MADFKATLQRYLQGDSSLDEVESVLIQTISQQPQHGALIRQGLEQLQAQNKLSATACQQLVSLIESTHHQHSTTAHNNSATDDSTEDVTRFIAADNFADNRSTNEADDSSAEDITQFASSAPPREDYTQIRPFDSSDQNQTGQGNPTNKSSTAASDNQSIEETENTEDFTQFAPSHRATDPQKTDKEAQSQDQTRFRPTDQPNPFDENHTRVAPQPHSTADRSQLSTTSTTGTATSSSAFTSSTASTTGWSKPFADDADATVGIGSVLKDRFRLLEFIGGGGMGDVYVAEDSIRVEADDVNTSVAIKILNKEFRDHPESFRAMQREARKTMDLAHPNIVNVFTFDRDRSNAFMVMELMRGTPLDKAIKSHPYGFPLQKVERFVSGMGEALKYAHQKGIIHCDFKPSNIFLDQDTVKVFDFGIARASATGPSKNEKDSFDAKDLGAFTENYASIELIERTDDVHPQDDIYALGCITYELLTGKHPFIIKGKKVSAVKAKAEGLKPQKITTLKRRQWKALLATLAFDRAKRTANVDQFLQEFLFENQATGFFSHWFAWPVIGLVGSAAAYFPAMNWWTNYEIERFADSLNDLNNKEIAREIDRLQNYDTDLKERYFSHRKIENAFLIYYQRKIKDNAREYDFKEAKRLATQATQIFHNSAAVANAIVATMENVDRDRKNQLNQLNDQLNVFLDIDLAVLIEHIDAINLWRSRVNKVEPGSPMLDNPRLQLKFIDAVTQQIESNQFDQAKALLSHAVNYYPNQADFQNLLSDVEQRQKNIEQLKQQTQVSKNLALLLDNPFAMPALLNAKEDILTLSQYNPNDPRLTTLDTLTQSAITPLVEQLLTEQRWDEARAQIEAVKWALSNQSLRSFKTKITQTQALYSKEINQLISAIEEATAEGSLTGDKSAQAKYNQLKQLTTDKQTLTEVQDSITQGWLKAILQARSNKDWQSAEILISQARKALPSSELALIEQTAEDLHTAKSLFENQQKNAQQLALEQQKAEQKQAELIQKNQALQQKTLKESKNLAQQFQSIINEKSLSISKSRNALRLIDQIAALNADHPLVESGRQQLLENYLSQVELLKQQKSLSQALQIASQGLRIFDNNEQLQSQIRTISAVLSQQKQQEEFNAQAERQTKIDRLLLDIDAAAQRAQFDGDNSTTSLFSQLQTLTDVTTTLEEAQAAISQGWFNAIFKARAAQQWQQGKQLINDAKKALPASEQQSLNAEYKKLIESEKDFLEQQARLDELTLEKQKAEALAAEISAQKTAQQQKIVSLKTAFNERLQQAELSVSNSRNALVLLEQIAALDNTDPSIAEGRQALSDKYLMQIEKAAAEQQWENALALTEEGLRVFPKTTQLLQQKSTLQQAQQAYQKRQQQDAIDALNSRAEQIIDNELADINSVANLDKIIAQLQAASVNPDQIQGIKTLAAIGYVNLSKQYTEQKRFASAKEQLAFANRFDDTLRTIRAQSLTIDNAEGNFAEQQVNKKKSALIDGLKQSFNTQINANDIKKAVATFNQLQQELPKDHPDIAKEMPDAIVAAYFRMTDQMAQRNRYTKAITLLQNARKYSQSPDSIDERQQTYERDKSLYLIGVAITKITVENLVKSKQLLDTVKEQVDQKRWDTLDQRLQAATEKQIKKWQQSKPSQSQALLKKAQELFPQNKAFTLSNKTNEQAPLVPPKTDEKETANTEAELLQRLNTVYQQAGKSIGKLLSLKKTLNKQKASLSNKAFIKLDNRIRIKVTGLVNTAAQKKDKNAKQWLASAKAYWPKDKPLQNIKLLSDKPSKPTAAAKETAGSKACTSSLAGKGLRRSSVCYDVTAAGQAPFMIVVPGGFAISKFEISNADYNLYCQSSGACSALGGSSKKPAVGLSIAKMNQYAAWLSKETGYKYSLPSASQWTAAANASGRRQPKNFNCRLKQGNLVIKGKALRSIFSGKGNAWGLVNYLGNAQEVVRSGGGYSVLGGSYLLAMSKCTISYKAKAPSAGNKETGFRLVRSL